MPPQQPTIPADQVLWDPPKPPAGQAAPAAPGPVQSGQVQWDGAQASLPPATKIGSGLTLGDPRNVGTIRPGPTFFQRAARSLPTVGGIVGGFMGIPGGPPGMAAGSIAGGVIGKSVETLANVAHEGLPPVPPQTAAQRPYGPPTPFQAGADEAAQRALDIAGYGLEQGAAEVVGGGAGAVTGLMASPRRTIARAAGATATAEGRAAAQYMDSIGGSVRPYELGTHGGVTFADNIVTGAPTTRGAANAFGEQRERLFQQELDRIFGALGGRVEPSQAGQVIKDARVRDAQQLAQQRIGQVEAQTANLQRWVEQANQGITRAVGEPLGLENFGELGQRLITAAHGAAKNAGDELYSAVDRMAGETRVSLAPLQDFVQAEMDRRGALSVALNTKAGGLLKKVEGAAAAEGDPAQAELAQHFSQALERAGTSTGAGAKPQSAILEAMMQAGIDPSAVASGDVTFRQAHEIRSALGQIQRQAKRSADGAQLYGVATKLREAIDTAMGQAAESTPGLREAYGRATAHWREMAETFEEGALKRAVDAEPAKFLDTILGPSGAVADIELAHHVLGDDGWKKLQAQAWRELSSNPDGTPLNAKQFLTRLHKQRPEKMRAMFGDLSAYASDIKTPLEVLPGAMANAKSAVRSANKSVEAARQLNVFDLAETATRAKSGEDLKMLRSLVGADGWKKVSARTVEDIFTDGQGGIAKGAQIMKRLPAKEQFAELVPDSALRNRLYEFARTRQYLESVPGARGGTGKMAIQLMTTPAVLGTIGGVFTGNIPAVASGASVLLTPPILSKIMLDPKMSRHLIDAMNATAAGPSKARVAGALAAKLLAFVRDQSTLEGAPPNPYGAGQGPAPARPPAAPAGRGPGPQASAGGPPAPPR